MIRVWRASSRPARRGARTGSGPASACFAALIVTAPLGGRLIGGAFAAPSPASGAGPSSQPSQRPDSRRDAHALSGFARQVGNDFRRLPSRQSCLWLGLGSGLSLVARPNDREVADRMASSHDAETFLDAGQWIGGEAALLPATLLLYGAGWWSGRPRVTSLSGDLLRAQIVSQVLTLGVKVSVDRARPDETRFSFPSGHASASFAIAAVLQRDVGWKAGVPAYATATYVAASRLAERRHWLSDVVFGASLGILSGRGIAIASPATHLGLAPAAVSGGTGLALVLSRTHPDPSAAVELGPDRVGKSFTK